MEDQEAARWRDWTNILGRVRFGTQKVAGKTISGTLIKAVAERVATYADGDGTRVRPGIARIAVDLETGHTTVRNAITVLERVGLLRLVTPATRTHAAVYRLIIGEQLIENVDVWSPSRHRLEVERVAGKYRGPSAPAPITDSTGVGEDAESLTPQESVIGGDDLAITDSCGVGKRLITDSTGSAITDSTGVSHQPRTKTQLPTNQPMNDPVAAVTGPRARDPSASLRRQYPELGPEHCPEHPGLAAGVRPEDGLLRCPICRAQSAPRPVDIRTAKIKAAIAAREDETP